MDQPKAKTRKVVENDDSVPDKVEGAFPSQGKPEKSKVKRPPASSKGKSMSGKPMPGRIDMKTLSSMKDSLKF